MLHASSLDTMIFRIAMTPPVAPGALSPFVFDMHPEMRVEFTHPKDQALGIANSLVVTDEVVGRTLCLGGGASNRYRYREFMNMAFGAMGLPPLPKSAFGDALFLTDWVDSEESQAILDYQRRNAAQYLRRSFGGARGRTPPDEVHRPGAQTRRPGPLATPRAGRRQEAACAQRLPAPSLTVRQRAQSREELPLGERHRWKRATACLDAVLKEFNLPHVEEQVPRDVFYKLWPQVPAAIRDRRP